MSNISKDILKVSKQTLLLIAGLVWLFAGFRVFTLGKVDVSNNKGNIIFVLVIALVIFYLFFNFIFSKMLKKHIKRIVSHDLKRDVYLLSLIKKVILLWDL